MVGAKIIEQALAAEDRKGVNVRKPAGHLLKIALEAYRKEAGTGKAHAGTILAGDPVITDSLKRLT